MKKLVLTSALILTTSLLMSGCVASIGNSGGGRNNGTLGQQLIDLQKAKDTGAISEAEYQTQKAKLLGNSK